MHKESLQRRSMQKQKTWGRGQIIKFEAGRDASQVQQWGVCMLDAWAWDDKDQQTMQPATKLHKCSSAYLEEGAYICRRFCHNDSPRREFAWWRKKQDAWFVRVRCRCSGWRLEASHDDRVRATLGKSACTQYLISFTPTTGGKGRRERCERVRLLTSRASLFSHAVQSPVVGWLSLA
jgi:hypothetical protein